MFTFYLAECLLCNRFGGSDRNWSKLLVAFGDNKTHWCGAPFLFTVLLTISESHGEVPVSFELHSLCIELPTSLVFLCRVDWLELADGFLQSPTELTEFCPEPSPYPFRMQFPRFWVQNTQLTVNGNVQFPIHVEHPLHSSHLLRSACSILSPVQGFTGGIGVVPRTFSWPRPSNISRSLPIYWSAHVCLVLCKFIRDGIFHF